MNLLQIILKQMRQRSLSTWLTLLSVLLGTSLAIGILILQREGQQLFAQTDFGYDILIGPPKGAPLQLTLNTVYHLDVSPGALPYALYADLARKEAPLPNHPDYRQYVRWAVPFMVGDSFRGRRIIGTSPLMFGIDANGQPIPDSVDNEGKPVNVRFQYRLGKSYEMDQGRVFAPRKFEAVVGAEAARALKLKLYDPAKSLDENLAAGGAFRATHGMPGEGETEDVHDESWRVVGILKPTGTANDRVLFVPVISLYAIVEHEEGLAEQALLKARFDPRKIPPERIPDALRQIGIDPDRLPESIKRRYKIGTTQPAAPAAPIGDLLQDAAIDAKPKDNHDHDHDHAHEAPATKAAEHAEHGDHAEEGEHAGHDHAHGHGHEEHEAYHLDAEGNITPHLPEDEWQISAVFVKARSGFAAQQLLYNFKVIEDRASAANPAIVMRDFFDTFLSGSTKILLVISALVTIVAGASIMTTIYNSVSARLREIAIFRALGATRTRILAMISLEAALIGFAGGVAGLVVGHLLCAIGSRYMQRTVGESINWTQVSGRELLYLAGVVLLAFLAGLVPALKAYRTPVADNLAGG